MGTAVTSCHQYLRTVGDDGLGRGECGGAIRCPGATTTLAATLAATTLAATTLAATTLAAAATSPAPSAEGRLWPAATSGARPLRR